MDIYRGPYMLPVDNYRVFRSTEYQQKNLMILGVTWNVSLVGTCIF